MDYGKAIRIIRAARKISQRELATAARLDTNYVSLLELGKRTPSEKTLRALTKALNVPHYLFLLLASDAEDLREISTDQAAVLGRELLTLLIAGELEPET